MRSFKDRNRRYIADFETTTVRDDCRVWAWGLAEVDEQDFTYGKSLDSFMRRMCRVNSHCYFHNLGFDGFFILNWLLANHYTWSEKPARPGEFGTCIDGMGKFYSITVQWKTGQRTEFRDSLKKLPFSVERIAQAFKLPMEKGELDYDRERPEGWEPTEAELDYLARDVFIVLDALKIQFDNGMNKLTVGSDSLAEYKRLKGGDKAFRRIFPVLDEDTDADIRKAYRGGWTYVDPRHAKRLCPGGDVYDVNSLYPSVMRECEYPFGEPEPFRGAPPEGVLFVVQVTFTATLKPDHVPCIQVKGSSRFNNTEYLTTTGDDPVTLWVTSVDLELWFEQYDVDVLAYGHGYRFRSTTGLFDSYVDKWSAIKAESTGGMRELAKLHLNSLYGKFATNPVVTGKRPILTDEGAVKLVALPDEKRQPVYTPVGVFVTAYARAKTIRAAQANYARFAYADTDSLHLIGEGESDLDVHPSRLGAWKHELHFDAAWYVRAKCYTEAVHTPSMHRRRPRLTYHTHVAGLPARVAATLTFDQFASGVKLQGKLVPRKVPGGVVLEEIQFELKR